MEKEELLRREGEAFVSWRRNLAKVEEENYTISITPFEKNVEVWKQLWRVAEKSNILVQIVDGRDPLFYRCQDLEVYTKELDENKINLLLVNKSDLLTEEIRILWNNYFNEKKINHIFFSALKELEKITQTTSNEEEEDEDDNNKNLEDENNDDYDKNDYDSEDEKGLGIVEIALK